MVALPVEKSADVEVTPNVVGIRDFVVIRESIKTLIGNGRIATIHLGFKQTGNKMPRFAISSVGAKELFWMLSEPDAKVKNLSVVKIHQWCSEDDDEWKNRVCDEKRAIHITFHCSLASPSIVEISFAHRQARSCTYCCNLSPLDHDGYLMILLPKEEFDSRRVWLTSNLGFFEQKVKEEQNKKMLELKN